MANGAKSSFARSTVETLVTTAGIMGCGLLNSVFLSRVLGPSGRGEVAAALLWPTLLVYFGSVGLMPAILFHTGAKDAKGGALLGTAWTMSLVQSAITTGIGYLAMPWLLSTQNAHV